MYNSCKFNTVKFNSLCLQELVVEEVGGGIVVDRRKQKVLLRHFFDIIGKKLIFEVQIFNLVGLILLAKKYSIPLNAEILFELEKQISLIGDKRELITNSSKLKAFKTFIKNEKIDIKGIKKELKDKLQFLKGHKIVEKDDFEIIKGVKLISSKDSKRIYGEKDIRTILEALDLLDIEE